MCAASIINNLIDVHHLYECMRIMRHEPYLARYIYIWEYSLILIRVCYFYYCCYC